MDKLGEGAYGIVYQARGNHILNQTSKTTKYMHWRKSDSKISKKVSLPLLYDKSPFSNN